MSNFNGKTAVVTGGTTGIGFATAKLLVEGGAKVVVTGRDLEALSRARQELGPLAVAVASDTSKLGDIDALVAKAKDTLGGVDFLFVNAGVARFAPVEAVTEQHYDEMQAINTRGAFFTVQKFLPLLRSGAGVVLNTSVVGVQGRAGTAAYAASKAALRSLARTLATELLPRGVRVNAVSPGPITTPIFGKLGLPPEAQDGFVKEVLEKSPMKRFGHAEEVARAALFLGFDATYTAGAELPVDGGLTQL